MNRISLKELKPNHTYKDHEYNWIFYLIEISPVATGDYKIVYLDENKMHEDLWCVEDEDEEWFEKLS